MLSIQERRVTDSLENSLLVGEDFFSARLGFLRFLLFHCSTHNSVVFKVKKLFKLNQNPFMLITNRILFEFSSLGAPKAELNG